MVRRIIGMGICDMVSEVDVNRTSNVNRISIIVSTHIKASMRCLCCSDRVIMVIIKVTYRAVFISSITAA